ncbi:MAG: hypothetical protein ACREC3_00675 [Methyloceanibacter sp.]
MGEENSYLKIGGVIGAIVAIPTFIGCWIYAISEYGFLLGVGLGWLPSLIVAGIAWGLTTLLWGPIAALLALGIWWVIRHSD